MALTVNFRVKHAAVGLKDGPNGDHLHYKITTQGQAATFQLVSLADPALWDDTMGGGPTVYEREWPLAADAVTRPNDNLTLNLAFVAATNYTVLVTKQNSGHEEEQVVLDYDVSGENDAFPFPLAVVFL